MLGRFGIEPEEPKGVYISSALISSQSGVTPTESSYVWPTNLKSSVQVNAQNASITYEITVYNNSDVAYWYLGPVVFRDYDSNDLIHQAGGISITTQNHAASGSTSFGTSDWIPPKTQRRFYATYTFGANAQGEVSTLVNFDFGLRANSVSDGLAKVLNDKISAYGYTYLSDAFNKKYAEDKTTVLGSMGDDKQIFDNIFGSNLTINVDGVEMPVTIMIERRNVDGKENSGDNYSGTNAPVGCEYTMYITVDNLNMPGSSATVYAVSYTCGADGKWYQIGELYEGECRVENYNGAGESYAGAFDVGSWVATEKDYTVTDDISYKVGYEQGTQYDKLSSLEELMTVKDQEFYNKVNNNSGNLLKPVCGVLYTYTHNNGQYTESLNYANTTKPGYDALRTAFERIKPYCLIANGGQEVKIQNASSLTRAELIQMLEEIQIAYDYYTVLNPGG